MLKETLKSLLSPSNGDSAQNNAIRFIQLLEEDVPMKKNVSSILNLDPFQRESKINTLLNELKLKDAPKELGEFFKLLKDDNFCTEIKKHLK